MIETLIKFNEQLIAGKPAIYSEAATTNDGGRQGDLYFREIISIPEGYKKVKPFRKMTKDNTKGAQHLFTTDPIELYIPDNWDSPNAINGPIVKLHNHVLEHPEHGAVTFSGERYIEFGYQKNWDYELAEIRRQQD